MMPIVWSPLLQTKRNPPAREAQGLSKANVATINSKAGFIMRLRLTFEPEAVNSALHFGINKMVPRFGELVERPTATAFLIKASP